MRSRDFLFFAKIRRSGAPAHGISGAGNTHVIEVARKRAGRNVLYLRSALGEAMNIKFAVVLSCLAVSGVSLSQSKPSQEQEIVRFVERYDNAWNQKDAAVIERILAPEYVYFSSKGDVRSRQSLLDELFSPKYILVSAERTEMKAYLTSGTAVVSSRWKGHGTYDGREFRDDQRCSIVLVREKQEWLVLSEHCTQIVAP